MRLLLLLVSSLACKESSGPAEKLVITPGDAQLLIGHTRQFTASGAAGEVTWSTGDPAVAGIVAATGFVTAIGRGSTQITASSASSTASAQLTVLAPPALELSAPSLDFDLIVSSSELDDGGSAPPQSVTVTNAGDAPLIDVTAGTPEWGPGQPTGWLTVTQNGTTAPVTFTFTAKQTMQAWGTFTAQVPISATGVANSPQYVAVTFRVLRPPTIVLNPASVSISGIPGVIIAQAIQVSNAGNLPLTDLNRSVTYGPGASNWLTAALTGTTAPATLNLTANTSGLAPATYTATVRVSSTLPGVAPVDLPVTLLVTTGPTIQLSRNPVSLSTAFGSNPSSETVTITNTGGGTLSGLMLGVPSYGAGQTGGWLTRSLSGSTAPATITIGAASSGLPSGSYTATLPVVSGVAANSPVNLTVNLTVGPAPVMAVGPSSVQFSRWGGGAQPGAQVVQITNTQSGPLTGLSTSVQYSAGATGWLTQTLSSTNAPSQLTLQPVATNLPAGQYTATVTVASSMPGVASRTVTVTYTVQTFTQHVYPYFSTLLSGSFTGQRRCVDCHTGPPRVVLSGTASQVNAQLQSYIIRGNGAGSLIVCKPFGSCSHSGGKFSHSGFQLVLTDWINSGAPFQ